MNNLKALKERDKEKLQESVSKLENTLEKQSKVFDKLMQYHPEISSSLPIVLECEKMGLSPTIIKTLLEKEEIHIKGEIYSSGHFKSFKVENLKLSIEYNQKDKSKILEIDGIKSQKWLDEKYKESLKFSSSKSNEVINKRIKR